MPLPKDNLLFGFTPKLTDEQRVFIDSMFDYQLTICNARSGTGKTTLAVCVAKLLGKDLVYIFSPQSENFFGFRPGTQCEKESAYIVPLKDALVEIDEDPNQVIFYEDDFKDSNSRKSKDMMRALKEGKIWVYPRSHVFARGTNIKDAFVLIDEAQNFRTSELRKTLTRIHDSCTVVMIGHSGQCDLENPEESGFVKYIEHFKDKDYANICELSWNFRGKLAHDADQIDEY